MNISILRQKFYTSLLIILALSVLSFIFVKTVSADTVSLSGNISDSSGTPLASSTIQLTSTSDGSINTVTSDNQGNYTVIVASGTYNVKVIPPQGSNFTPAVALSRSIFSNTILNFKLVPVGVATLSGHIYDPLGNPVTGQRVTLNSGSFSIHTTTDASGSYSLQVTPGNYGFNIIGNDNALTDALPRSYTVYFATESSPTTIPINQSIVLDVTLPAKKVDVYVQDAAGNPVSDVEVKVSNTGGSRIEDIGGYIAVGEAKYSTGPKTDANGKATVWLLRNNQYVLNAVPPTGIIYSPFILQNVAVTGNQTEVITLQYNHNTPVSAINVASEHNDGTYSNPATVTLSAVAASGYSIANIFYRVDGGTQQTYNGPFDVSGNGDHAIEYWSVDNSGVQEAHKTRSFTIYVNKAPFVEPLADVTINEGETYTATGSFSDPDSSSWTATVDYGEGAGPEPLTLNPDKTFNLQHQYSVPDDYTVVVVVHDNQQATGTTNAKVLVNGAPEITSIEDREINLQDELFVQGSFVDEDSTSWAATVDYGDESGEQNLPLDGKNFVLNYTYQTAQNFKVTVRVQDNQGAQATEAFDVFVNAAPIINDFPGGTLVEGSTYSHAGYFSDPDSTSWTGIVNYGDGSGDQPLTINPDNTFVLSHIYKDNDTYPITVTITDNQGAPGFKSADAIITNAAPLLGSITASINPIQVNTATTATVPFSDLGILDTHTAVINWGDGSTTTCPPNTTGCTITEADGSGNVSGSHVYQSAGVYEISISVTDNDGAGDSEPYQYLSVYNPTNQGLFSGARMFTSPAGAYVQNPNLTGQIQFGITTKYQGTTPTGNVSMKFNAANLEFESTSISVFVTANNTATLRGTGTINGQGNYVFLVTGLDGGPSATDYVRFKITDPANNNAVLYDSQRGSSDITPPSSSVTGQIIVH